MRARLYLAAAVGALVLVGTCDAKSSVPPLLFPVVGAVSYHDDFGEPRAGGAHQGNDLIAAKRAPAIAVEDGTVEYWTTSSNAGCMLYLHGASGTMYEYIHLNNDLTTGNDNKGKCVQGVAYAVPDGARVVAGEQVAYVGDSGDANGLHAHLHFEVHPNGGDAVSPFKYLKRATHLLAPMPPTGKQFTLKLTGTVMSWEADSLTMRVASAAAWPSHVKQSKLSQIVKLVLPPTDLGPWSFAENQPVVVWTLPAPGTVPALSGAAGELLVDRVF
jgi:Peptidase family M23